MGEMSADFARIFTMIEIDSEWVGRCGGATGCSGLV